MFEPMPHSALTPELIQVYLAPLKAGVLAGADLSSWEYDSNQHRLMISVGFPPPVSDDRRWAVGTDCARSPRNEGHIWDVKPPPRRPRLYDVPLGGMPVHLRVSVPRYECRFCKAPLPPHPEVPSVEKLPAFTERLRDFVLVHWTDGYPKTELRTVTGLPAEVLNEVLSDLPQRVAEHVRAQPLPRIIGIDELHFRGRYNTVFADLSIPGRTRLLNIIQGRPERQTIHTPDNSVNERPLREYVQLLAKRYVADPRWRRGSELLVPVVTLDGWRPFRELWRESFEAAVQESDGELASAAFSFVDDLFHLKKNLNGETASAKRIIKARTKNLRKHIPESFNKLQRFCLKFRHARDYQAGVKHRAGQVDAYFSNLGVQTSPFRDLHRFVMKTTDDAEVREYLLARLALGFKQLDEYQERLDALVDKLHVLADDFIRNGYTSTAATDAALAEWNRLIKQFDKRPQTRFEFQGYKFSTQDAYWFPDNKGSYEAEVHRQLLTSAKKKFVSVYPDYPDYAALKNHDRKLFLETEALVAHFSEPVNFIYSTQVPKAEEINDILAKLKLRKLFHVARPSNSRIERLNGRLRVTVDRSNGLTFESLRHRLISRHGGLVPTVRQYAVQKSGDPLVIRIEPPTECPACASTDVLIHSKKEFDILWLDLPIGWRRTNYRTTGTRWRCSTCGHASPSGETQQRGRRTEAFELYLSKQLVREHQTSLAPEPLWASRIGVATATVRQALAESTGSPPEPEPPVVIGLDLMYPKKSRKTGNHREAADELKPPKVLIADLRHKAKCAAQPAGQQSTASRSALLPARLLSEDAMEAPELIERLQDLRAQARQPLIILINQKLLTNRRWRQCLTQAPAEHWRVAMDLYSVRLLVRRTSNEMFKYWQLNTRTKIIKSKRQGKSATATSRPAIDRRNADEAIMRKIFLRHVFGNRVEGQEKLNDEEINGLVGALAAVNGEKNHEPHYCSSDVQQFHQHLHALWPKLITLANNGGSPQTVLDYLQEAPDFNSPTVRRIYRKHRWRITAALPLLLACHPNESDTVMPNTRTERFHSAALNQMKAARKLERARMK